MKIYSKLFLTKQVKNVNFIKKDKTSIYCVYPFVFHCCTCMLYIVVVTLLNTVLPTFVISDSG